MVEQVNISQIRRQTVEDLPDAKVDGAFSTDFWRSPIYRGTLLPAWGTREREKKLREYDRHEYNWMGQSAIGTLARQISATPWEIKGKRRVDYFQQVLRQSDLGRGWTSFVHKVVRDYCRHDSGAWIEVVAPGKPDKAPTGPATAIKVLDSIRVYPTGDPEYPAIYYDRNQKMHMMHRTRAYQIVDMPDTDESRPGYGLCATSRAVAIITQQIYAAQYVQMSLDRKPQPGIAVTPNISRQQWDSAWEVFYRKQQADVTSLDGEMVVINSLDPTKPADVKFVTFAQPPTNWDYKVYTELQVHAWALALGLDPQDLWQLTGGNIGSQGQSQILHAKSQGKTFGELLVRLERVLNDILPPALEYQFKRRDPFEAAERAQTAQLWAGFTSAVKAESTPDERRRILANMVEAFADAVMDENGEIVRLPDSDVREPDQQVMDDGAPPPPEQQPQQPPPGTNPNAGEQIAESEKAIQATTLDFESDFEDLLALGRRKAIGKRSFVAALRSMIADYGRKAYMDGLNDGAVAEMDEEDSAEFLGLLSVQGKYVSAFADEVYAGNVSDVMAADKPTMWVGGSIQPFYEAGRFSADRNGVYEFTGDDGMESCTDCRKLKGQRHRMRTWTTRKQRPRIDRESFECGGWRCEHKLSRVREKPGAIKARKGYPEFNPNQPRGAGGQWAGAGGAMSALLDDDTAGVAQSVFGKSVDRKRLMDLTGAPDGTDASIKGYKDYDEIRIEIRDVGDIEHMDRVISTYKGEPAIYNESISIRESARQRGVGWDIFQRQVNTARQSGVRYLRAMAAGAPGSKVNGYYTWARFGYDGDLTARQIASLPSSLSGAQRVSDLMLSADGRDWWKANGEGFPATFDLSEGSRSMQIFNAYSAERATRKAMGDADMPKRQTGKYEEPPVLTDEDEALLDRIWDNIGKESAGTTTDETPEPEDE